MEKKKSRKSKIFDELENAKHSSSGKNKKELEELWKEIEDKEVEHEKEESEVIKKEEWEEELEQEEE